MISTGLPKSAAFHWNVAGNRFSRGHNGSPAHDRASLERYHTPPVAGSPWDPGHMLGSVSC